MKFLVINETEFKQYEEKFENSYFYQTTSWSHLKKENHWDAHYTIIKDQNKVVGIGLCLSKTLFFGKKIFYFPRGFLTDYHNEKYVHFYTEELKKYVKKNQGIFFKIDPLISYQERDNDSNIVENGYQNLDVIELLKKEKYVHKGFTKGYTDEYQARWSYALDIENKTFEELFEKMHQRAKRSIKKYQKYPFLSKFLTDQNIDDFYDLMEHTNQRQGQPNRSKEYYQKMYQEFAANNKIKILVVYLDKKEYLKQYHEEDCVYHLVQQEEKNMIPLACGLFIEHAKTMNYVYGGARSEYMKIMAQYKVQCDMIAYSIERHLSVYDFGGITGDFDENSHAYGIYGFKRGFAGYVIEYIGEFDYPVQKGYYILYKILYKGYEFLKKVKRKKISTR